MTLRIGIIGVGHLGRFHVQKYAQIPEVRIFGICDTDIARAEALAREYHCRAFDDYEQLLGHVDAVSIVVPTPLHYKVALFFLSHHIHVLIEKPITLTLAQADELIALAKKNNCILQVGHLERFNPALLALKPYLNNPRFIECIRIAPFQLRGSEVNVALDLMIHDIDIILSFMSAPLVEVHAVGTPVLSKQHDIIHTRLVFANGCIAQLTASRISFKTERTLRVFQQDAYFSVNLHTKEMAHFKKGSNAMPAGIPDIICEQASFPGSDALLDEIKAFVAAIVHNAPVIVRGEDGRAALAIALQINAQMDTPKTVLHPLTETIL